MNLLIDIGNTHIKTAVFKKNQPLIFTEGIPVNKWQNDFEKILSSYPVTHALISTTGKPPKKLKEFLSKNHIVYKNLKASLSLPFTVDYKTPHTLGADRIALVAGAVRKFPKQNRLIIDAGTCITYDFVDKEDVYKGGAISPGLDLRFKSMHEHTANLPLISSYSKSDEISLTGKDTLSCLKSGAIRGAAYEIQSFIENYKLKHKDLTVFLTGGSQIILERYLKNEIFVNSKFLLFEGMNVILNMNK